MGIDRVRDALRVRSGSKPSKVLGKPGDFPVGPTSKSNAAKQLVSTGEKLDKLQEALYAGAEKSVLLVLQGMDTSGKGGTIRHACGLINPQGLHIKSFKKPTRAELRHDFLWRIRRALPTPGQIGVFDRSHYEDVLIARVDSLVAEDIWQARYDQINTFEQELADSGITLIKCFLHISPEEQRKRLEARLLRPEKHWKYNPADLDARSKWPAYQQAYLEALQRCDTDTAPWYVVPSDHKWYRNWAVSQLLLETLEQLDPQYPEPDFDVETELERVRAS
ncbi:PPK2 family polyphosphate:nucleotide phosphotransferase [Kibdelosporangium banguiense]|uniref:PPK2 family polyphosphate:nucleotide phosphotransferase n=1 Tax=Kibdelosporangium banguiense TaxID=1365924 RepID=A0ABS4U2H6_9PSEU|nr:PPK2 family polyphosphate kinase [Kibdelosporangium banguiense]MBP2330820.1 PPK2 family polyphosphate:nucleotide phosphotransferase [Kibdelosporangium banguiense]